jgi:hypothetical protein
LFGLTELASFDARGESATLLAEASAFSTHPYIYTMTGAITGK